VDDLQGRTAFITGGGQGIGLGIATALAKRGVRVALADIDEQALSSAAERLRQVSKVETFVLDVCDRVAYEQVAREVEATLGPVSILCNNAGVAGGLHVSTVAVEQWDWVIGVNLTGVFNGVLHFVPSMIERRDGHIVNTASVAGLVAGGGGAGWLYHTSKFGVVGMSEALRAELEPFGVGVSVLCPGRVATDILANTARRRPDGTPEPLTDASGFNASWIGPWLAGGLPPDDVGELVADGVVGNRPYILTDGSVADGLLARTEAILAAID